MSRDESKVVDALLNLGFSFDAIDGALEKHTWIKGDHDHNLAAVTNIILNKNKKKRKSFSCSDAYCPPSKRPKISHCPSDSMNQSQRFYDDMIQLLNEGVISYCNSKKFWISFSSLSEPINAATNNIPLREIRGVLEQKYELKRKQLKGNKYFEQAVQRVIRDIVPPQDDTQSVLIIKQETEAIPPDIPTTPKQKPKQTPKRVESTTESKDKPPAKPEMKSLRDLKAELSAQSGGCNVHGLGHHLAFNATNTLLEMHCNQCSHALIADIPLPVHLTSDTSKASKQDNDENSCDNAKLEQETDATDGGKHVQTKKRKVNEWNCYDIIYWLNRVSDGKLAGMKYQCLRKQIRIGNIKGFELANINDTTLKLIGIKDAVDRKLILNHIFDLQSNDADQEQIQRTMPFCVDIPESFCDPISYELMQDPVMVTESGHTYERTFIEDYVKQHGKDPITQKQVQLTHLVCNRALKESIESFQLRNAQTLQ